MKNEIIMETEMTCPKCSHKKTVTMSKKDREGGYDCEKCHAHIKPEDCDCCIYCSHGSVQCPLKQNPDMVKCCGGSSCRNPKK